MPIACLTDRAVLAVRGADARDFLQGLLTNDIAELVPGRALWAGLLSAQGKALFEMMLHADGDDVLIDVDAGRVEALAKRLALYRLRRAIAIEAVELAVWAAWGSDSGLSADGRLPVLGYRWLAGSEALAATAALADYHRHRRLLGVPQAVEIGEDRTLWLEANAAELQGVSFTKGCYVGQENTARMHHRDKLRRRILPVRLAGEPADTDLLTADGKAAGELRAHDGGIGMAWLRLEHAGGPLSIGPATAEVIWPGWLAPL